MTNHHELDAADNTGQCPDGATDEEHDTMLTMTGQCPWCGLTTAEEARRDEPQHGTSTREAN
jgi:hypothetical protein